jgi:hypothetical protein
VALEKEAGGQEDAFNVVARKHAVRLLLYSSREGQLVIEEKGATQGSTLHVAEVQDRFVWLVPPETLDKAKAVVAKLSAEKTYGGKKRRLTSILVR